MPAVRTISTTEQGVGPMHPVSQEDSLADTLPEITDLAATARDTHQHQLIVGRSS